MNSATPILSPELFWLTLTAAMTGLLWLPYIVRLIMQAGLIPALSNRLGSSDLIALWAQRAKRAHYNAVENLVVFATLVLIVQSAGFGNSTTALACQVYFYARLAHYIVYVLGVPLLRTLLFGVGVACQVVLAAVLLGFIR